MGRAEGLRQWSPDDGLRSPYTRIYFLATTEPQPWPCYFCNEPVSFAPECEGVRGPHLHHINHDHGDDRPSNLAWCHPRCHSDYHTWVTEHLRLAEDREMVREYLERQKVAEK